MRSRTWRSTRAISSSPISSASSWRFVCGGACEFARAGKRRFARARRAADKPHGRRGIRRPVCRETPLPHLPAQACGEAQARARADRGARALPSAQAQAGAPGEEAHRAPDLPQPPRGAESPLAAGVASASAAGSPAALRDAFSADDLVVVGMRPDPEGERRTAPKSPEKQDASNLLRPAGFVVRQSTIREPIEFSGLRIGLDLTIPRSRVEFDEPASKLRQFFGRQAFNLLFELFDFSHRLVPGLRKMVFYPVLPTHERKERWPKPIGSSATTRSRTPMRSRLTRRSPRRLCRRRAGATWCAATPRRCTRPGSISAPW